MTVPDLPLEIVTLILEDLYEPLSSISPNELPDKSALRACRMPRSILKLRVVRLTVAAHLERAFADG